MNDVDLFVFKHHEKISLRISKRCRPDDRRTARGPQVHNDSNEPALGYLTFPGKRIKKVIVILAGAVAKRKDRFHSPLSNKEFR